MTELELESDAMKHELLSVQYLRAAAAVMVVLLHVNVQLTRFGYQGYWPDSLARGVDIFFVISGFIMWVTTAERPVTPLRFYLRRIVRIVPLYWLLTSFTVATMLVSPALLQSGRFDLAHVVASYLFLPARHPTLDIMVPVVVPGWTLNYEMFFYAAFGAALLLPIARGRLAAILVFLLAVVAIGVAVPGSLPAHFYGSSIILEFGFGVALGSAFVRGRLLPRRLAWPSLVVGAVALMVVPDVTGWQGVVQGIPALAIVAGAVSLERTGPVWRSSAPRRVGDASYSLYLSHGIVLSACGQAARRLGIGNLTGIAAVMGWTAFVAIGSLLAIGVALIIFQWFERPLARLSKSQRRPLALTSA